MKKIYFLVFCLSFWMSSQAQTVYSLRGYVRDTVDNKPLVNASINIDFGKYGALTDEKGFFEINLPNGEHAVTVKFVGYRVFRESVYMRGNYIDRTYTLHRLESELEEVIVSSKSSEQTIQRPLLGVSQLSIKTLKKLPAAVGELDILRGLQMLPGVVSVGEASNGVNIRGGTTDQNLLLLDEMPIFNPTHMFGLFTAFPSEGTSNVELYKGNTPARFGGRAAAVMDVSISNPSLDKFKMNGGISFVSNRLTLDMPIIKDKVGLMVSGRASYNDFLLPVVSKKLDDIKANFADAVFKGFWRINNKNTFTVSGYYSKDFFQTKLLGTIGNIVATATKYDYRTQSLSARWFYAPTSKFNIQTSVVSSYYIPQTLLPEKSGNEVVLKSDILYRQAKSNVNYYAGKHKIEFGLSATHYTVNPNELIPNESKSVNIVKIPLEYSLESAVYAEDEITFSKKTTLSLGLRYSQFFVLGPSKINIYEEGQPRDALSIRETLNFAKGDIVDNFGGLEPRMGFKYAMNEQTSFKAGFNLMRQYIQVVTNTTTPLPTSRWKTSDRNIKPQISELYTAGLFHNFTGNIYEISVEGYYRNTNNIIDYKPGADFLLNENPETLLLQGINRSYGLEMMVSKKKGETTGWINYTYARSKNQVSEGNSFSEQVNFGNWYRANYDRPHTINASVIINQGKHNDFSFNFTYSTGRPFTSPQGFIQYQGLTYPFYDLRNNARIPDYHRLDFAWNIYQPSMKEKRFKSNWTFTIYNLYGRKNAYSVFLKTRGTTLTANKLVIFGSPIISLSYNFKFM